MKKVMMGVLTFLSCTTVFGQTSDNKISMEPDRWDFDPESVEFITHRSVPAAQGLNGGAQLFLKDFTFENGTIEFDVELSENGFVGINFRMSEDRSLAENFYLRAFWPINPLSRTTLQYATVVDDMSLWDLTDDYQAPAPLYQNRWNHVKLVVNGRQMLVYVNDQENPALHVPILEGETESGSISFGGNAIFANLVIRSDVTEGLPATAGYDPTAYDSYYLRDWFVTQPIDFPLGRDINVLSPSIPDSSAQWTPLPAEHRALVNLSRAFGMTMSPQGDRRLAWLKTTISSEAAQTRRLDLGFSDEVWVFINGQLLHIDKNYFGTPSMKEPRGRCSLANTSFDLPLQAGENEILIGLANSFFGWGIIARLDNITRLTAQ